MRTFLLAVLALMLLTTVAAADAIKTVDQPDNIPSFLGYVPDRFIVVTSLDVTPADLTQMKASAVPRTGDKAFDQISDRFAVTKIERQFKGAERRTGGAELAKYHKVTIGAGDLESAMDAYRRHPLVERVEPIGIHSMYATPSDFYYSYQWHLNQASDHDIDAPEAWDIEVGQDNTIVAILDSGTRYYHPDLGGVNASPSNPGASRGNMWINNAELNGSAGVDDDGNGYVDDWIGYDFIQSTTSCWSGEDCSGQDNDPRDFNGHGTHTSGIFGMITNDGYGMCGVAGGWLNGSQQQYGNGVKIMALRMGYSYNYGGQEYGVVLMDAAAEAFYYAADNGAKIASCSWGSSNSGGIGAAATYFINHGGVICVAAGNDGTQTADYLNGRGDCISVAATDENDNAASFTTYGTWVDICAPGINIYSTYHDHTDPNTNYWAALSGTSMATPMVAGVCALIWSHNPSWTSSQVKTQLFNSADNIDAYLSSQYIGKMGAGRINAYNAVNTGPPPAPVAAFSGSPTSGTEPLTVNFTDLSTGSITSWSWTFGDGGTSTAQNPSHQYSAGTYTVSLTVTGPGGSDGETKTNYITVNPCTPPTAGFVGSPTSGDYPLQVNFTNQSSGATSYDWTFGDGGTSTATNPSHTYMAAGTFTVTLTAYNSCGSDQMVRTNYITVTTPPCDPPVADFSGSPTSGDYPFNVSFTDLSTNSPTSWSWTFGDGGTSTAQNPNHTYTAEGSYTVTLTATNACGSDGETKIGYITVTEPSIDYASLPYSTGFESGSFDQYWFTQSDNSEGRILITTANGPHSGSYHMTMDDNTNGSLYAQNEAWLRVNLSGGGDIDLTFWWKEFSDEDHTQDGVFFSDNGGSNFTKVYSLTGGSSSYQQINLDVDQLAASNGLSLTGTFVIKFQQYDNYGITTDGMAFDDISVTVAGPAPPVAEFSGSPTSGCAPLTVDFTDESTGQVSSWSWTFGDGGTSTAQNPSHQYQNGGTYTVSLTVTGPGGSDGETKTNYITVNVAPTAEFSGSPLSGEVPLQVNFTDQSTGSPSSWSWNFGDAGTSTSQNPSHTYTAAGTYTVTLTASNACGSDQEVKTDYITVTCSLPVADFSGSPTSGSAPLTVDFTDLSSSATSWDWTFGDGGTSTAQNPSHQYTNPGTYTVTLTATNSCGSDGETKVDYITVTEPSGEYADIPYSTGFESGSFDQYWFTQSSNSEGRILITTANGPHSGSYHMTMDDNTNGSLYAQNEAWLKLNLAGKSAVNLSFWWKEFSDEDHTQDGVFFSDNGGSNFTKVYSLTGGSSSYQQINLDVDQLAASNGLSLTGTFVIKFQQYDNYGITTDGMAFDDISVSEPGPSSVITFDDFESGFGNYTDGGSDCSRYTGGTYAWSGSAAIDIQDNSGTASSFYHTNAYDVSGYGTQEVEFYFIAISMDNPNEDFWVQYYDGSSWNTVAALAEGIDFDNGVFYNVVVTIPSSGYNFPSNARLRFVCDASGNADDVYIDDIEWRGLSTVTAVSSAQLTAVASADNLVKGAVAVPVEYSLSQNYPNPFNAGTNITFGLTEGGDVELIVYNVLGQTVRHLASQYYSEGVHTVQFDATDDAGRSLASGMYFYRLNTKSFIDTKKMILLK